MQNRLNQPAKASNNFSIVRYCNDLIKKSEKELEALQNEEERKKRLDFLTYIKTNKAQEIIAFIEQFYLNWCTNPFPMKFSNFLLEMMAIGRKYGSISLNDIALINLVFAYSQKSIDDIYFANNNKLPKFKLWFPYVNFSKVKTMRFIDYSFDKQDMEILAKHTALTGLFLAIGELTDESGEMLTGMTTLINLTISNKKNLGLRTFSQLSKNTSILNLTLESCSLKNEWVQSVGFNPNLTELNISNNLLESSSALTLSHHPSLTALKVSFNKIGDEGVQILAKNTIIIELDIHNNLINAKGAMTLAENLSLKSLGISCNNIQADGLHCLFANSNNIEKLDATDNNISFLGKENDDEDLKYEFLDSLKFNTSLRTLNLLINPIDYNQFVRFAFNTTLTELYPAPYHSAPQAGLVGQINTVTFQPKLIYSDEAANKLMTMQFENLSLVKNKRKVTAEKMNFIFSLFAKKQQGVKHGRALEIQQSPDVSNRVREGCVA